MNKENYFSKSKNKWDIGWPMSPRILAVIILALTIITAVILIITKNIEKTYHTSFGDFVYDTDYVNRSEKQYSKSFIEYNRYEKCLTALLAGKSLSDKVDTLFRKDGRALHAFTWKESGDTLPRCLTGCIYTVNELKREGGLDSAIKRTEYFRDKSRLEYLKNCIFMWTKCKEDSLATAKGETYQSHLDWDVKQFNEKYPK